MKKICVVTGYRSDYTKLKSVIEAISLEEGLELQLLVFGAHLLPDYGKSIDDIKSDAFEISYRCSTNVEGNSPLTMSKSIGLAIIELTSAYEQLNPDVVLICADRYEIMAAAIAASVGNIPVAHIQGGEISGTIDETIRHAITKLSHIHFPSTELSKKRVLMLGENPEYVFNVGCPAIDYLKSTKFVPRPGLKKLKGLSNLKIDIAQPYNILIQHPVTTEHDLAAGHLEITLNALQETGIQTVLIYPNPDAGSNDMIRAIRLHLRKYKKQPVICNTYKNICFNSYLNLLKHSNCLVGNSSSGIREAHFFNIPVINIGTRQNGRERTLNIVDIDHNKNAIKRAIERTLKNKRNFKGQSLYGDGLAGARIAHILSQLKLGSIIQKTLKTNPDANE